MFERYTEKARRVIFFARYEASHYGSPEIDTEHLLLGLVREEPLFHSKWLPKAAPEIIREHIDSATPRREPIPTNVDLPLSQTSKRVLNHAKDEADRLNNKHIGTEHLLLGLIQEKKSATGKLLRDFEADLSKLRKKFEGDAEPAERAGLQADVSGRLHSVIAESVEIHGVSWDTRQIHAAIRRCRAYNWHWRKETWVPRDVVIETKTGRCSFELTLAAESEAFQLVKGGWKKDYCAICQWELFESQDEHGSGYTDGREWVCNECYEKFWQRPDFIAGSYSDIT